MKLLNKQGILAANDITFVEVSTPEWAPETDEAGKALTEEQKAEYGVRIRNLTGEGRGAFIQNSIEMKRKEANNEKVNFEIELLLIAMTAVDSNNQPIFQNSDEDLRALGQKNAKPIARLAAAAQQLSALDKASQDEKAKN